MGKFAENTSVSVEKSRLEIERTLQRYGATGFAYGWESCSALIGFSMKNRQIRFILPLPDPMDKKFQKDGRGSQRNSEAIAKVVEQASRQRWRALNLAIKAKLECVDTGITTFEDEFLAHIVLPNGSTVGREIKERIEAAYQTGKMPLLLGAAT